MSTTTQTGFVNTNAARIVAAVLALLIAIIWFYNYSADFSRVMAGGSTGELPQAETLAVSNANPALAACLEKRVGDVDQMKEDGLLNDQKYASFKVRAEQLCAQQNPAQQQPSRLLKSLLR